MKVSGHAKLNLCLAIRGTKNGKHLIDSVFYESFLADELELAKADTVTVEYKDGRTYENDTAFLTAKEICKRYGLGGVKIEIDKHIPEGAGLGGSSVDAGAVARGMKDLFSLPEIDTELLSGIGSDVPYCYYGGNKRVSGLGEKIRAIDLPKLYAVILVPKGKVDTGKCYALYDEVGGDDVNVDDFIETLSAGELPRCVNALERAAKKLNEGIQEGLDVLREAGFCSGMTGSGCAVFGIETDTDAYKRKMDIVKKHNNTEKFSVYEQQEE